MAPVLDFAANNPGFTIVLVLIVGVLILAGWSDYLDRKHGERP